MAVTGGLAANEGQEACLAFVSFLKASKLPECLWEVLLEKVSNGQMGTDGQTEVNLHSRDTF